MIRRILGTNIVYRYTPENGMEVDYGDGWHFTFRGWDEIERMHSGCLEPSTDESSDEQAEREVFGETLDEEIPDELWEMLNG